MITTMSTSSVGTVKGPTCLKSSCWESFLDPSQVYHRETRSGTEPGKPPLQAPCDGLVLSKVCDALLLEGRKIRVW